MRNDIKYFVYVFILGMGLVAYANENFMTKTIGGLIFDSLKRIETKVDKTNDRIDRLGERIR